jgi:hypothetical protein
MRWADAIGMWACVAGNLASVPFIEQSSLLSHVFGFDPPPPIA